MILPCDYQVRHLHGDVARHNNPARDRHFLLPSVIFFLLMIELAWISPKPLMLELDETGMSAVTGRSVVLVPADGEVVSWHDMTRLEVTWADESPDISNATSKVVSDRTGVIGGTSLSVVGDTVRISLPERDCDALTREFYELCPSGEHISANLSGVVGASGTPLVVEDWDFDVGLASIRIISPIEGTSLNSSSVTVLFEVENHSAQTIGPHIHYGYDEHDSSNQKMHKSSEPVTFHNLADGEHLLFVDLRSGSHDWLGHLESVASVTVTVDTTAPSVENEQISPAKDASNVPLNSSVSIRLSEQIVNGSTLTLSTAEIAVNGSIKLVMAGSKSELTFLPDEPLLPGTLYTVQVGGVADMAGNPMQIFTTSFTTISVPDGIGNQTNTSTESSSANSSIANAQNLANLGSENWIERWGELTLAIAAIIVSGGGWLLLRRRRAKVRSYLVHLSRLVEELGNNVDELDRQIDRMKSDVELDYHKGRIDEQQYQLVEQKLEDARNSVREQEIQDKLGDVSSSLSASLKDALADGRIDASEVQQLLSEGDSLGDEQRTELKRILMRWKDEDDSG